jgi:hypothetical protein
VHLALVLAVVLVIAHLVMGGRTSGARV